MKAFAWLFGWVLLLAMGCDVAHAEGVPDADIVQLDEVMAQMDADPALHGAAGLERLLARQAIDALVKAGRKDRPAALKIAQWRVETARLAAEVVPLAEQSRTLDQERDAILVEASRRDAERARRESERLRLQTVAREEEAERNARANRREQEKAAIETEAANQEAEQARKLAEARALEADLARQEAELAAQLLAVAEPKEDPKSDPKNDPERQPPAANALIDKQMRAGRTVYTLSGTAFATGKASITPTARDALGKLAAELKRIKGRIRIEGYTDNQGTQAANLALSQQRAEAVSTSLLRWGIAASRLQARGMGETAPVASNQTSAGRSRNRRVEIILE